jgi:hypothetical protein
MFRESLHRGYQTLIKGGRKRRSHRVSRTFRPGTARLDLEGLEDRNLLSTLTLNQGALVYSPSTTNANTLRISFDQVTQRYTIVDAAEGITLIGNFINPSGDYTHTVGFGGGNVNSVTVDMFDQDFTVNLEQTQAGVLTTVNLGNGNDTVNVSPTDENLDDIKGPISIQSGLGTDVLNVLDQSNTTDQAYGMGPASIIRTGCASINYGSGFNFVTIYGGQGNNTYDINSTEPTYTTTLITGNGQDMVNVESTGFGGSLTVDEQTGGSTINVQATSAPVYLDGESNYTVNIGNAGSVQAINGPVTIISTDFATVNVDDSGDTTFRTVTLDTVSINGEDYGGITGLAPAGIFYRYTDTYTATVQTGTGGATVDALATGARVDLVGNSLNTMVNVGDAGSVQAIHGSITVTDPPAWATINVDDSADSVARTVTMGTISLNGDEYGDIGGLAPADILYRYGDTNSVNVHTNGATVNVLSTGAPVYLIGSTFNDVVNVGLHGSVQDINSPLTITNAGTVTTVNVDDSADTAPRTVTLDTVTNGSIYGRISGLAPADIFYRYADTYTVTVQTGTQAAVNVFATGVPVNLICNGSQFVNVGDAGSVQAIQGALTITDPPSFAAVNVDDSADTVSRTVYLDTITNGGSSFGRITGLAPAAIEYKDADTASVTVETGTGGNTVYVLSTVAPVNVDCHGHDTVNVGYDGNTSGITGELTISDPPSFATINVNDAADGAFRNVTVDTVILNGWNYGRITGLSPADILYKYDDTQTVSIRTGVGGAAIHAVATGIPVNLIGTASAAGGISLYGSDAANTWNITGHNAGTLSSSLLAGTVTFSGTPNLHGGIANDSFVFANGAGVDGSINGGGGTNLLDYSAYASSVIVDLKTGFATGVNGGVSNIQNVTGGNGGGAGVYNILVGNGGNVLTGGDGRTNLLIAGASPSALYGGNEDDILIGGTTAYDTQPGLTSLKAIMNYWSTTSDKYATRVNHLLKGKGVPVLDHTTVANNGAGNTMMGHHGGAGEKNLFYGLAPALEKTDYNPVIGERFINC